MKRADDSPATWGDIKLIYKRLNDRISDAFEAIAKGDDDQTTFWNEHEDKIGRQTRALRRLNERVDALEEDEDD